MAASHSINPQHKKLIELLTEILPSEVAQFSEFHINESVNDTDNVEYTCTDELITITLNHQLKELLGSFIKDFKEKDQANPLDFDKSVSVAHSKFSDMIQFLKNNKEIYKEKFSNEIDKLMEKNAIRLESFLKQQEIALCEEACSNLIEQSLNIKGVAERYSEIHSNLTSRFTALALKVPKLDLEEIVIETENIISELENQINALAAEADKSEASKFQFAHDKYESYLRDQFNIDKKQLYQLAKDVLALAPNNEKDKWQKVVTELGQSLGKTSKSVRFFDREAAYLEAAQSYNNADAEREKRFASASKVDYLKEFSLMHDLAIKALSLAPEKEVSNWKRRIQIWEDLIRKEALNSPSQKGKSS